MYSVPRFLTASYRTNNVEFQGKTLNEADRQGFRTARLPVQEFSSPQILRVDRSPVLSLNQVVELLLTYSCNGNRWTDAICSAVPKRYFK